MPIPELNFTVADQQHMCSLLWQGAPWRVSESSSRCDLSCVCMLALLGSRKSMHPLRPSSASQPLHASPDPDLSTFYVVRVSVFQKGAVTYVSFDKSESPYYIENRTDAVIRIQQKPMGPTYQVCPCACAWVCVHMYVHLCLCSVCVDLQIVCVCVCFVCVCVCVCVYGGRRFVKVLDARVKRWTGG